MTRKSTLAWSLIALSAVFVAGCTRTLRPVEIMELNRNGKWSQAVVAADAVIRARGDRGSVSFEEVVQAYFQKAYAETRLGKGGRARETIKGLDTFMGGRGFTSKTRWMYRETDALRRELGLPLTVFRPEIGAMVRGESSESVAGQLPREASEELGAFRALCQSTGAEAFLVAKSGRIVDAWYREPMPRLYDAGAMGRLISSAALFRETQGRRILEESTISFADLEEGVLQPAALRDTNVASRDDGIPDLNGPLYTTPRDLASLALWLQDIGYFNDLARRNAVSPWRRMHTPDGFIAVGRNDTFVAVAGDLVVVRFQGGAAESSERFQRAAAPLLAKLAAIR